MSKDAITFFKKFLSWGVFIYFYLTFIVLILFLPLITYDNIRDVVRTGAPKMETPLLIYSFFAGLIYISLRYPRMRFPYKFFPVLQPAVQMAFVMGIFLEIGLRLMNLWADDLLISKTVAIIGTIVSFLLGRAFLSYWYFKYPISSKINYDRK